MKTKKLNKTFLFSAILLALFLLSTHFSFLNNVANASQGSLKIIGPDIINTSVSPTQVEFIAELSESEYTSDSIEWFFNQTLISSLYYTQGITTNTSTLRLSSSNYSGLSSGSFATVKAQITHQGSAVYEVEKEVMIIKPLNTISVVVKGTNVQEFNSNGNYDSFMFTISNPVIPSQNVSWYLKEDSGKYNLLTPQPGFTNKYQLTRNKPGTYTVVAKVDEDFSNPVSVKILHDSMPSKLDLVSYDLGKNNLGFTIYKFELEDITENHDVENINWYRKGYSSPLQYGGSSFLFEPNSYATYQIYARYEPFSLESTPFIFEIKIDRTKDILIFSAVIISVMTVGLVFLIYRSVKKDKVW